MMPYLGNSKKIRPNKVDFSYVKKNAKNSQKLAESLLSTYKSPSKNDLEKWHKLLLNSKMISNLITSRCSGTPKGGDLRY